MINAVGVPASLLVLGGASDIGLALAKHWARRGPLRIVLAGRPSERFSRAAEELRDLGCTVETLEFDARATQRHREVLARAFEGGEVDVALVAFGVLGDPEAAWQDHRAALELAETNYLGAVSVGVLLADQMRARGHGVIVLLSSVAGERVRRSNFVYGSTKAGVDGFYAGLGQALAGSGARVLVVRPGFVSSQLTAGLEPAPLAVTPAVVAEAVARGVADGRELIWVPGRLRFVMSVLRHLPRPVFRRLDL